MKQYTEFVDDIQGLARVEETVVLIQKVAASNILAARSHLSVTSSYEAEVRGIISRLLAFTSDYSHPLLSKPSGGTSAVVLLGSDKGIVGSLWHELIDAVALHAPPYGVVIGVGRKIEEYSLEAGIRLEKSFPGNSEGESAVAEVWSYCMDGFTSGRYSSVDIVYPHAASLVVQETVTENFLPCKDFLGTQPTVAEGIPIFESQPADILGLLLSRWLRTRLTKMFWETRVAEYCARTSMSEHAQEKTRELIGKTKAQFITARKRDMTRRQLESFISHTMI